MVFLTALRLARARGPDEWWRKRKVFKLAAVSCCQVYISLKKMKINIMHIILVFLRKKEKLL
jgi:hypothetical protein